MNVKLVTVFRGAARHAAIDRDISRFGANKRCGNTSLKLNTVTANSKIIDFSSTNE
jgi:hypothetical protein